MNLCAWDMHVCHLLVCTSVLLARQAQLVCRAGQGPVCIPSLAPCCAVASIAQICLCLTFLIFPPHFSHISVAPYSTYPASEPRWKETQAPSWNKWLQQPKQLPCTQIVRRLGREVTWAAARFWVWMQTFGNDRGSLCGGTYMYIFVCVFGCVWEAQAWSKDAETPQKCTEKEKPASKSWKFWVWYQPEKHLRLWTTKLLSIFGFLVPWRKLYIVQLLFK